jgi:hypothetical protein
VFKEPVVFLRPFAPVQGCMAASKESKVGHEPVQTMRVPCRRNRSMSKAATAAVSIVNGYGLDSPGSNTSEDKIFRPS